MRHCNYEKSLCLQEPSSTGLHNIYNNNSGWHFTLKFIPCADLICSIYLREAIWAARRFTPAVINNALASDFMFGDISVSDILRSRWNSHVVHSTDAHFDNKSFNMLNIRHPSSEKGPEIISTPVNLTHCERNANSKA